MRMEVLFCAGNTFNVTITSVSSLKSLYYLRDKNNVSKSQSNLQSVKQHGKIHYINFFPTTQL